MALTKVRGAGIDADGQEIILDADGDTSIDASTGNTIVIDTGGSERMRIDSSGNVLVATTTLYPGQDGSSSTGGMIQNTGTAYFSRASGYSLGVNRSTNDGTIINLAKDGSTVGSIQSAQGRLAIGNGDTGVKFSDSDNSIMPFNVSTNTNRDNAVDLGFSTVRFDDIFATNGTIQTSDENEKQDIASATAKELNVAKKLSTLFKTFRWKDKVTEKGDKARTHTGIVAQEVQSAFKAEGLDASNYGLFTSDTWWEKEISVDAVEADEEKGIEAKDAYTYMDTKEEKTDGYTEKTRLGVRYPELLAFIGAATEQRLASIEARLIALESK